MLKRPSDAKGLYHEFQKIRKNLDRINTPNLSKIKEVVKRIYFADILNEQQALDNTGDAFYKIFEKDEGKYFGDLTLSYTIKAGETGVVYGLFREKGKEDGSKSIHFKDSPFTNYARFMADIASWKVIFSRELDCFVIVDKSSFIPLSKMEFEQRYPVEKKQQISDFLDIIETIYREIIKIETHDFQVEINSIAGTDWIYDCQKTQLEKRIPNDKELFLSYNDVKFDQFNFDMAKRFFEFVADGVEAKNNLSLILAYVMQRKLNLIPAEHWFLMKDFGRTGKGLFMTLFSPIFNVAKINFDALSNGGSFEAANEWARFHNADVAHANETGEITQKDLRVMRKVSTNEFVTGRSIGKDTINFQLQSVLILDTNESVDIGEITANKSRVVKIAFKDRPKKETEQERHKAFKPFWDFINDDQIVASLSFLIYSMEYLKKIGGYNFEEVTLKNYFSADDFTETQKILLTAIANQGYILSSDATLKEAVQEDYGGLRYAKAKTDIQKIGIRLNHQKKIEGRNFKVHNIGDKKLFEQAINLINNDD